MSGCYGDETMRGGGGILKTALWLADRAGRGKQAPEQSPRTIFSMYIKFCRSYGEDKKDEASENLSPGSKLSVKLEGGKAKPAEENTRLYRAVCLLLAVICLVLLLLVIVLSLKLQTGSTDCPQLVEDTCSYERCQAFFPSVQTHDPAPQRRCQQCADGWLTFGRSCFFLSTFRLNWNESQRNCSDRGGSLAVINSQSLQQFLTKEGKMQYWIGLRQNSNRWTWVNNTVLQQSYWAGVQSKGDCGVLGSDSPAERNWFTAPCHTYTYFICQLQM